MVNIRSKPVAFTYQQILEDKYARHQAEVAEANAQLEQGRLREDDYQTREAADRLNQLNLERRSLDEIANNFATSQQQPQGNRFGLNRDELEVAKISGISDEQYARNKSKMESMKQQGYWSQGRVFK
jgi:hypothetical protein